MARNQDEVPDNDDHIGLSAEEIAAMEGEDDDVLKDDDEDDAPTIDPEDDEDDEDPEIEAAAAAAAADSADEGEDPDDTESDIAEADTEFQSSYKAEPVENYKEQLADFAEQKKALRTQLSDGDIDMDAYEEAKDAITDQEQALREQNLKATIAAEQSDQEAQARWVWEQERFFADKTNDIYKDKFVTGMLDLAIKDLAQQPDNAPRSAVWFLNEADRMVRERIGKPRDAKAEDKVVKPNRKPDLSKIPKTIGDLPSAELPDTGEEEFAHLDRLVGTKYEQALAKLTPTQQARYLGVPEE